MYDAALCFSSAGIIPQQICIFLLGIYLRSFIAGTAAGIYIASAGLRH